MSKKLTESEIKEIKKREKKAWIFIFIFVFLIFSLYLSCKNS